MYGCTRTACFPLALSRRQCVRWLAAAEGIQCSLRAARGLQLRLVRPAAHKTVPTAALLRGTAQAPQRCATRLRHIHAVVDPTQALGAALHASADAKRAKKVLRGRRDASAETPPATHPNGVPDEHGNLGKPLPTHASS